MPTLRDRVLNLLQTAAMVGVTGVSLVTLSATLDHGPEEVLESVLYEIMRGDPPPIHCKPDNGDLVLVLR